MSEPARRNSQPSGRRVVGPCVAHGGRTLLRWCPYAMEDGPCRQVGEGFVGANRIGNVLFDRVGGVGPY